MNNLKPFGPRDEAAREDGDAAFAGVDEKTAPQQLPAGYVAKAQNKRFRNGRAATREGIILLPWMKTNGRTPFSEVYGGFVYNDVTQGGQWILMAADGGVWKTRPNYVAQVVPLPAGVTLTKGTFRKFLQCNGEILLLRGAGNDTLHCTNLEEGFKPVVQINIWGVTFDHATNWVGLPAHNLLLGDPVRFTVGSGTGLPATVTADATYYVLDTPNGDNFTISADPGGTQILFSTGDGDAVVDVAQVRVLDGAETIPPCEDGIFFGNRAILVASADAVTIQDRVVVTDIGDVTRAQVLGSEFRINEGDGYSLVTARVFNDDTIVFFKSGNVQKVTGVSGDLSGAVGPSNVTEAYGAVQAPGAVVAYGTEIYWLNSELKISSLRLTELNAEQGTDVALSDTLVQTFGRMNATYARATRLAVYDGYLLCALPLDEAEIVDLTELVAPGQFYNLGLAIGVVTVAGKNYQYRQGATGGKLINGTETLQGDCDFTAQGATVALYPNANFPFPLTALCTDSLKLILASGVNTGVAVYDFLNQAWAGSDEAAGVTNVVDWLKFEYGGKPRLGFIGADGWLHLYAEGYEDDLVTLIPAPYVDVIVQDYSKLGSADTVQVNGGTVAVANSTFTTNLGTRWGVQAASGGPNLWRDSGGTGGYDATAASPWTAPNTIATQIADGVRFTATNGIAPAVQINGVPVTDGMSDWALVDAFSVSSIQSTPIQDLVRTRAYKCVSYYGAPSELTRFRRFTHLAGQLSTWSPQYTLTALVQGVGAQNAYATGETRNRLKYFAPHDATDYDPSNANNDYDNPRREDYSTIDDPGTGLLVGDGFTPDGLQDYVHRVPVSENGLWLQLEVANANGRLELVTTAMESQEGQLLAGPAIA